jgi:hypothetical protein
MVNDLTNRIPVFELCGSLYMDKKDSDLIGERAVSIIRRGQLVLLDFENVTAVAPAALHETIKSVGLATGLKDEELAAKFAEPENVSIQNQTVIKESFSRLLPSAPQNKRTSKKKTHKRRK